MRSKSLMTLLMNVTASTEMGRLTIGRIIRKKICRSFAPSTRADSITSAGMLFTAAERMTVANAGRDDRDDQPQEDDDACVEDDPQHVVPEGSGGRERREVDEVWIAEQADVVVKAHPLVEDAVTPTAEAEQHRVE